MRGLQIHHQRIGSPTQGFFGMSVQMGTNLLIKIVDESGQAVGGVRVQYTSEGTSIDFANATADTVYQVSIPTNIATPISLSKPGYVSQTFSVTIGPGAFQVITRTLILSVTPYSIITKRN